MGYTHYFKQLKPCSAEQWGLICEAFRVAVEYSDMRIVLNYEKRNRQPRIDGDVIQFNGRLERGHETMMLCRNASEHDAWGFCKTAQKPYDLLVVALLCIADHYAPECWAISSDGFRDEWSPGQTLAQRAVYGDTFKGVVYIPAKVRQHERKAN